jgi:hypothetical protein
LLNKHGRRLLHERWVGRHLNPDDLVSASSGLSECFCKLADPCDRDHVSTATAFGGSVVRRRIRDGLRSDAGLVFDALGRVARCFLGLRDRSQRLGAAGMLTG